MICFLTSNPFTEDIGLLDPANGFIEELERCFPNPCSALYICSDPNDHDAADHYAGATRACFEQSGFFFSRFSVLDGRNPLDAAALVKNTDLIMLAGGHVPTQNRFFHSIGLRELMKGFSGVVIGISAGSMNSADVVYSQPELEGEAIDPFYQRFLVGLDLTKTMLLPHYQSEKDDILDGLRLFEDITYPDSMGRTFYAIPDGSYLYCSPGKEEIRGEAYRIRDGIISRLSSNGEIVSL